MVFFVIAIEIVPGINVIKSVVGKLYSLNTTGLS
jgi:hypothetical protein